MFVILKVTVKWRMFDGIPFYEIRLGWLLIVESRSITFSVTCVLFWAFLAWKKIHNIAGTTVIGLNGIFSVGTERYKCFSSHKMFAYFAPSNSIWSTTAFLLFKKCYFPSHKNVFQIILPVLNPIIGIFSKTFPCFLSGVNSKCISDSMFLNFEIIINFKWLAKN